MSSIIIDKMIIWKDGLIELISICPKCGVSKNDIIHNVSEDMNYKIIIDFAKLGESLDSLY